MSQHQDVDVLVRVAASGDGPVRVRAAGRLMTLLESDPHRLPELFRQLPLEHWPQPRLVLGVTGAPGAGKSTLVAAILTEIRRRDRDRRVGVIAVDPSSPFTGGALLGDRVRMMRHATDPGVFIRSLATRGHLGGLALGVKGVLRVMGLVGCDAVLIETVGVGQSEVEVARVADRVAVVLAPGGGDSVQLLKAGLMEVADLFVVNKADAPGAEALHRTLLQALNLTGAAKHGHSDGAAAGTDGECHGPRAGRAHAHTPTGVWLVSANSGDGIPALVDGLFVGDADAAPDPEPLHNAVRAEVREAVLEAGRRRLERALDRSPERLERVLEGAESVDAVVHRLFASELEP